MDLAAQQIHDFIEALAEANFGDNKGAASAVSGNPTLICNQNKQLKETFIYPPCVTLIIYPAVTMP